MLAFRLFLFGLLSALVMSFPLRGNLTACEMSKSHSLTDSCVDTEDVRERDAIDYAEFDYLSPDP